jgi:hypothetical protein
MRVSFGTVVLLLLVHAGCTNNGGHVDNPQQPIAPTTKKVVLAPKKLAPAAPKKPEEPERPTYTSSDGAVAIEVIDDLPPKLRIGHEYRITHYVRNLTKEWLPVQLTSNFTFSYNTTDHGSGTESHPHTEKPFLQPGGCHVVSILVRFEQIADPKPRLKFNMGRNYGSSTLFETPPTSMQLKADYDITFLAGSKQSYHINIPELELSIKDTPDKR